ncbi:MAG: aminoglycoside phosphotransferase family protein [Pseudomonadota bacterium]
MTELPNPAAWGLPDCTFERLHGGSRNVVLRGTGETRGYVFKSTTRTEAQLAWLWQLRPHLSKAGVIGCLPVPAIDSGFSHKGWTAEPFVAGRPLTDHERFDLADVIAGFHALTGAVPQRPGFASSWELLTKDIGGDVDLSLMPLDLVAECRSAWRRLSLSSSAVLHGDLYSENVAVADDGAFILYDWDEARVDHPCFDLAALGATADPVATRAALAFEIACCWQIEPDRAQRLAHRFMSERPE